MHAVVNWTSVSTRRQWSSEFWDALEDHDDAKIQAVMVQEWRFSQRLQLSNILDVLWGHDQVSMEICTSRPWLCALVGSNWIGLEIVLEPTIEQVWRCYWRPWSSEIGGVPGGSQAGGGSLGGRRKGSSDSIHWITCNCWNIENSVQHDLPRDEKLAGSRRQSVLG